jgi:hypothetical protein
MNKKTGTGKYEKLVARCQALQPIPTAVAYPCEETALAGAIEAGEAGLIEPILVGPAATIRDVAKKAGIVLGARVPIILTSRADSGGHDGGPYAAGEPGFDMSYEPPGSPGITVRAGRGATRSSSIGVSPS